MSEQLSGRALDKAIAEALGKRLAPPIVEGGEWYGYGEGRWTNAIEPLTPYHADANATLAVCAERGWALAFCGAEKNPKARFATITIFNDADEIDEAEYQRMTETTYQEAAARALLAALTATADR